MKYSVPTPTDFLHPMTFKARGTSVTFTTPLLAGARVRQAARDGVELLVPNPSGGRGIYVLNWPSVRTMAKPTVHDTVLFRRCSQLATIDPAHVREAALEVASEGHAGRAAAAAAEAAITHDHALRVKAHFLLVTRMVEQADPNGAALWSAGAQAPDIDRRASLVLHQIAALLRRPVAEVESAMTALGDLFAPVGIAITDRDARIPRLLICLEETHTSLSGWLTMEPTDDVSGLGQAVATAIARIGRTTAAVLEKLRSVLADPRALLVRWMHDPVGVAAQAARCDWLLDGWERVCLLWLCAETSASRRAALFEMAPLLPVLPREVLEWTDTNVSPETMKSACSVTSQQDTWRTGGSAFALIERNEKLLARGT